MPTLLQMYKSSSQGLSSKKALFMKYGKHKIYVMVQSRMSTT